MGSHNMFQWRNMKKIFLGCPLLLDGFFKNLSFKIAMSRRAGVRGPPRFTFWLTFLKNSSIML